MAHFPPCPSGFQPTPSSRRETLLSFNIVTPYTISTHSLLAEGDDKATALMADYTPISTHSLLAEGDETGHGAHGIAVIFQPTPSSRRETRVIYRLYMMLHDISTHSLLAEGDLARKRHDAELIEFQPTPSSRRETPLRFERHRTR